MDFISCADKDGFRKSSHKCYNTDVLGVLLIYLHSLGLCRPLGLCAYVSQISPSHFTICILIKIEQVILLIKHFQNSNVLSLQLAMFLNL